MSRAGSCEAGSVFGSNDSGRHDPVRQVGKPSCPGVGGVGRQSVEAVHEIAGDEIRLDLRVVHAVAAADGQARIAVRMPAEADARLEVFLRIGQRLPVVAQAGVDVEVVGDLDAVLHECRCRAAASACSR